MRAPGLRGPAAVLMALPLLAGCLSTPESRDLTVPAPTGIGSSTPAPPSAATESETGESPGSACDEGWVVAEGGFCFMLPAGFEDWSGAADYGRGWTWRTWVSIDAANFVMVTGQDTGEDFDSLDDAALARAYMADLALLPGVDGIARSSAFARLTVDGGRGIRQSGTLLAGGSVDQTVVYRGGRKVRILCESTTYPEEVASACEDVLTGIKIA